MYAITIIRMVKCLSFLLLFSLLIKCTHQESLCGTVHSSGPFYNTHEYITFNCTLNPVNGYASSDIVFLHEDSKGNFKEVDSSKVVILNPYTAQLVLETAGQTGRFICEAQKDGKKSSNETVCESSSPEMYIILRGEDWRVSNLTCRYLYLEEISCSWNDPVDLIQVRLSEHSRDSGAGNQVSTGMPCSRMLQLENGQMSSVHLIECIWEGTTFTQLGHKNEYIFAFRYVSFLGQFLSQEFHQLAMISIVQLDPPTSLKFTSENATLSWDYPGLYPEGTFRLFQFKVSVVQLGSAEESNVFLLGNDVISWKVEQLKPDCEYNFNVSIKVDDGKNPYWSEPASLTWRTKKLNPVPVLKNERAWFPLFATCIAILAFLGLAVVAYCRFYTHSPNHIIVFSNKNLLDPHEQL